MTIYAVTLTKTAISKESIGLFGRYTNSDVVIQGHLDENSTLHLKISLIVTDQLAERTRWPVYDFTCSCKCTRRVGIFDYCPTEREREREIEIYNEIVEREVGLGREREKENGESSRARNGRGGGGVVQIYRVVLDVPLEKELAQMAENLELCTERK